MSNPVPLLLIEDDLVDVMSFRRALRDLKVNNNLSVASNGEDAMAKLRNGKLLLPCLIVLDVNMPRMNGLDFLKILRSDERLRRLPVVVLTTSREKNDLLEAFELGVAGYMIKPVDYADFVEVVRLIQLYWSLSEMPPEQGDRQKGLEHSIVR